MKFLLFIKKYGLIIVLFFLLYTPVFSQVSETDLNTHEKYKEELIQKAVALRLHEKRYWRILLHYLDEPFAKDSHIDDPQFFLSTEGKTNPEAELIATIRAIFQPKEDDKIHPTERFIARFVYLTEQLQIDINRLPYNPMPVFEAAYAEIDPVKLYIMFPSGYIESPASMFGHTFLLLENRNQPWHKSLSINYAAHTEEISGLLYAFKGLTGLYKGYFSYLPYHKKITEYNDIDSRDLWEYAYNFKDDEIRKMILHLFELQGVYSNYYFLDENCSYNLLFLLEAARPTLQLVNKFNFACEPIDTLREMINQDCIESVDYRPSKLNKIHHYASKLSDTQVNYAIDLALNKKKPNPNELNAIAQTDREKAIILDLAADHSQYLLAKDYIKIDTYRTSFFAIIKERSNIEYEKNEMSDISVPIKPEDSHYSKKVGIGIGLENERTFSELQFRFTNHNLMDDERGLNKNSQLIFGNLFLRYFPIDNEFLLQRFDIVDIDSLSLTTRFGLRIGMFLKSGFARDFVEMENQEQSLSYYATVGPNLVFSIPLSTLYTSLIYNQSHAPQYEYWSNIEFGGRLGMFHEYGIWKSKIEAQYRKAFFINEHDVYIGLLQERFAIDVNNYIMAEAQYKNSFNHEIIEYVLKYQHCFR
jgi:hypothetical protein